MDIKIEGNIMYIRYLEHEDYVEINLDEFLKAPVCYTAFKVSYDTETHEAVPIPTKTIGNTCEIVKGEEKDKIMAEFERCNEEMLKGKHRELFPSDNITNEK